MKSRLCPIIWYISLALAVLLFATVLYADARPIQVFDDIKEKYQDYQGNWRYLIADNLANYPPYLKTENSTYYTLQRMDDNLTINKNISYNGSFNFRPFDISFTIEAPASKIAQISQTNGSGQRRIRIPISIKQSYKRFDWDNKLPVIILKNQTWNMTVLGSDYWYSQDNGLWFNFKTANVTGLASDVNASFIFTSWYINNATTIGYTSININTDGYWSAFGGGSIGTPLNSSIHMNLSGYWDCESTTGTTEYGINKYGRFQNSSIHGTWNGNTTLNYTAGQNWGNACSFNGVNDYINIGNIGSPNVTTISTLIYPLSSAIQEVASSRTGAGANGYELQVRTSVSQNYFYVYINGVGWKSSPNAPINLNSWNRYVGLFNGNNINVYLNDVVHSTVQTGTIATYSGVKIGRDGDLNAYYFNGSIDEIIIDSSGNPIFSNSTYAPLWNFTSLNQTADAGKVINAIRFNISNLNVQNNTANISARQNGTSSWARIATNYVTDTWINQTYWASTDFLIEVNGNGSSRVFIVNGDYDVFNFAVTPDNGTITHLNVTKWNVSGDYSKNITLTLNNASSPFTITACDMQANKYQNLNTNGTLHNLSLANSTGCISYYHTAGNVSNLIITIVPAETNPVGYAVAIGGAATITALYLYRIRRTEIAQYLARRKEGRR